MLYTVNICHLSLIPFTVYKHFGKNDTRPLLRNKIPIANLLLLENM